MFELGDPPDYEPPADTSIARRAEREGRDPLDLAYDLLLADEGRGVPLRAVPQLRRRQPRRGRRDARPPQHRRRSRRRRRARRHDLRRQLPDDAAHALGAGPRPRSPRPAVPRAPPHAGDGAHGRPARPRCPRPGLPRRRERHRLRPAQRAPPGDAPRPARRREAPRADGRRLRRHDRRRARSPTSTARRPDRCPAGSSAGRKRHRRTEDHDDGHRRDRARTARAATASGGATTSATATSSSSPTSTSPSSTPRSCTPSRVTDDVLDITRDDFPLPTLGAELAGVTARADQRSRRRAHPRRARRALRQGRGRRRSTGASARTSAQPWPQNAKGHLLGDVTDQGRAVDDPTARGNEIGGVAVPVPLRRLRPRRAVLPRRRRERRREPRRQRGDDPQRPRAHRARAGRRALRAVPVRLPRRAGARARRRWYTMPIFTRRGDRLFVRYIRPYIESSRRHDDAPRPSDAARAAMDRRRRHVRRPAVPRVDDDASPATCSS